MQGRSQQVIVDVILDRSFDQSELEDVQRLIKTYFKETFDRHEFSQNEIKTIHFNSSKYQIKFEYSFESHVYYLNFEYLPDELEVDSFIDGLKNSERRDLKVKTYKRADFGVGASDKKLKFIFFIATFTAICSMLYELLLAQSLSSVMGNTALRYNTTIGLYIASMGVGALFYRKIFKKNVFKNFINVEILLSMIGAIAPILALVFDFGFRELSNSMDVSYLTWQIQIPFSILCHSLIVVIGILSGVELPLFIDMAKSFDFKAENKILAFDYLGTLLGAILFPILILPYFNIFTIGYLVSFCNLILALIVMKYFKINVGIKKYFLFVMIGLWGVVIFNATLINDFIVQVFYLGGIE